MINFYINKFGGVMSKPTGRPVEFVGVMEILAILGISYVMFNAIRYRSEFPKPHKIGAKKMWLRSEIKNYAKSKAL